MTVIDTAKVAARRKLRFESIEDALAEIDRLLIADQNGKLTTLGNWTPGQIFSHIAAWIDYGYDGYPLKKPPLIIRWILRLMRPRYLRSGLPTGVKIPGVPQGTVGMDHAATASAGERLKQSFARLARGEEAKFHSPAFGEMNHAERTQLNLRHAELHLGFLAIEP